MLSKDEQIAVVLNEYGSFQGIITLEDVIETILGDEIVDENDLVRDMQELALEKWKRRNQMAQKKQKNRENPDKA
jgi:CBS domain containing-hemolysin-like protein